MMPSGCKQSRFGWVFLILSVACTFWFNPAGAQTTSKPASQWTDQLRRECRQLVDMAIRRPYGWAWPATQPAESGASVASPAVDLNPPATPAAGMVLALAGKELNDPQLTDAALQVVYGLASAQQGNGRVPATGLFGASAGSREPHVAVADRSPTIAALGLFLIVNDQAQNNERLDRATRRALNWLLGQQTSTGGWAAFLPEQSNNRRMLRLDSKDFRNATLALYLAGDCLRDAAATRAANKAVDLLLRVRFPIDRRPAAGLWSNAYQLSGEPFTGDPQAGWIDLHASSEAIQTLIGAALLADRTDAAQAVDQAIRSMLKLPHDRPAGWERFYNPDTAGPIATTRPVESEGLFTPPIEPSKQNDPVLDRLDSLFRSAAALRTLSREDYTTLLSANRSLRLRIALALCGQDESPFSLDLPLSQQEAQRYLQNHAEQLRQLETPSPEDLDGRVKRIFWLINCIRVEQRTR